MARKPLIPLAKLSPRVELCEASGIPENLVSAVRGKGGPGRPMVG